MIFLYCLLWNIFIWGLFAALVAFQGWTMWWLIVPFIMTTFPGDIMNDDEDEQEPKGGGRGGPPLAGA